MSLKQKIKEKAKTINELEKILYQKSRYTSREFIYEKDKRETWITVDDVTALLDEATKQVRLAFSEGVNEHGYHWHYDGPDYARARCEQIIELYEQRTLPEILQKILAILDGKEKAKP